MSHLKLTSVPCDSAAFAELSGEILRAGKSLRFQAHGTSMLPLVRDGDILLVQPLAARAVGLGDLVLFCREPGQVVVHRVIRVQAGPQGRRYTVQGDAVAQPDGSIPEAQVYGRVAALDRGSEHIDMDRAVVRVLGWLAALRSRGRWGRGRGPRLARWLVKRLPGFSRYLA
jgi:signal peptidase I